MRKINDWVWKARRIGGVDRKDRNDYQISHLINLKSEIPPFSELASVKMMNEIVRSRAGKS